MIRGALGGAFVVFTKVAANAYGLTGIPMIAIAAPFGVQNVVNYVIGMLIAVAVSFILTIIFKVKEVEK